MAMTDYYIQRDRPGTETAVSKPPQEGVITPPPPRPPIDSGVTSTPTVQAPEVGQAYKDISEQQKTNATGVLSQPQYDATSVRNTINQAAPVRSGDDSVSNKSLVQTQLQQILGQGSPLMTQAESRGEVAAARRGQLGSSMGIGAAQGAVISQGLEIAKPDAATYANANLTAQQAQNQQQLTQTEGVVAGELNEQKNEAARQQQAWNNSFQAAMQSADQETAVKLQDFQQQWQGAMKQMELDFEEWSTQYQVDAQLKQQLAQRRAETLMNHQIAVQELLGDPAFLELGGEAVSNLMNTMADGVISTVKYDMLAAGYTSNDAVLTTYLDDLATDLYLDFSAV